MANNIFDCLIEDVEPKSTQKWPAAVHEVLQGLRGSEDLENSSVYNNFVNGKYIETLVRIN